jgi:hypothetical protein
MHTKDLGRMLSTLPTLIAFLSAFAIAAPNPGDGPDCQRRPERCVLTTTKAANAPAPTSTGPILSTSTYTTSYCSVETAIPFTRGATWYEQSCTQIAHTTTTTDYSLQWGCETTTVTTAFTIDNKLIGGS